MDIKDILRKVVEHDASDLHLAVGVPPIVRKDGKLKPLPGYDTLNPSEIETIAFSIINIQQKEKFENTKELDLSFAVENVGRFRVNMFRQRGSIGIVFRSIPKTIPTPEDLGLPAEVVNLTKLHNGLVLVTGPTGSGKSTTLAALINKINNEQSKHILTIEDPIEFIYEHRGSIVNQRQLESDTISFANALRAALREDPDVILIGEMRDLETVTATLTIAETGHLVFATLHTIDVAQTIGRIIDIFPPDQQQQIRMLLSTVLRAVICQQLLTREDTPGRVAAREILITNAAICNLIREGQTQQIYSFLQTGRGSGMMTMDAHIEKLYNEGKISKESAMAHLVHPKKLPDLTPNTDYRS